MRSSPFLVRPRMQCLRLNKPSAEALVITRWRPFLLPASQGVCPCMRLMGMLLPMPSCAVTPASRCSPAGGYGTLDETLEITTWQQLGAMAAGQGVYST